MNTLATITPHLNLMPADADKDTAHRIGRFEAWLGETGRTWSRPDLAVYRDKLLADYAPSTVSAHLLSSKYCDLSTAKDYRICK